MWLQNREIKNCLLNEIKSFFKKNPTEEGCGMLLLQSNELIFQPCENISPYPKSSFLISPKKLIESNPVCIVHSHLNSSADPSEKDRISSNELCIPFLIYSLRDNVFFLYNNICV